MVFDRQLEVNTQYLHGMQGTFWAKYGDDSIVSAGMEPPPNAEVAGFASTMKTSGATVKTSLETTLPVCEVWILGYERKGTYNGSALREALDIAARNNIMLTTDRSTVTLMKPDVTTEEIQSA